MNRESEYLPTFFSSSSNVLYQVCDNSSSSSRTFTLLDAKPVASFCARTNSCPRAGTSIRWPRHSWSSFLSVGMDPPSYDTPRSTSPESFVTCLRWRPRSLTRKSWKGTGARECHNWDVPRREGWAKHAVRGHMSTHVITLQWRAILVDSLFAGLLIALMRRRAL